MGQVAELPVEPLAAGVVVAGVAPAIAAPVAKALHQFFEPWRIGKHDAAFTHGDMVGGIEAAGGRVTKLPDMLPFILGPERIAAILDQPKVVLAAKIGHCSTVERIAKGVRKHHSPRAVAKGCFQSLHIDVVGGARLWMLHIDKHRHEVVLQNRIDRRGKARSNGDHFISPGESLAEELGRSESGEGHQIGARP